MTKEEQKKAIAQAVRSELGLHRQDIREGLKRAGFQIPAYPSLPVLLHELVQEGELIAIQFKLPNDTQPHHFYLPKGTNDIKIIEPDISPKYK